MYTPPPQARKPLELLFSLHYFPIVSSGAIACAGLFFHALSLRWTLCLALPLAAVSLVTHLVEPIMTFGPIGGQHGVRTLELCREVDVSAPPLTLFYPTAAQTSASSSAKLDFTEPSKKEASSQLSSWLPFQDVRYLDGMAGYAHLPAVLLRDMKFTRIRESQSDRREPLLLPNGRPRPIIVFSHGISGYPRLYSCLLMDLAARGALVVAMSHQDGSAAFCRDARDDFSILIDTALDWEVETRETQMMVRVKETRATLDRLQSGQLLRDAGYAEADVEAFLVATVRHPAVTLIGHSFGGATVMGVAMEEEAAARAETRSSRVRSVVALDPWGQPLCGTYFHKAILAHDKKYTTPTLQFHSEGWVRWKVSWDFFRELAKDITEKQSFTEAETTALAEAGQRTMDAGLSREASWYTLRTSSGTAHLSYCDLAQLSPVVYKKLYVKAPARAQLVEWANECLKFAVAHDASAAEPDRLATKLDEKDLLVPAILTRQREAARANRDTLPGDEL